MKIKVITAFEGECLYKDITVPNMQEYCDRHGYELVTKFDNWDYSERYYYWRKVEMIKEHIGTCDYLLFLDADCLITDQTKKVEDVFDLNYNINVSTDDWDIQCGGMFFKNSDWTINFLNNWWAFGNIRHPYWKTVEDLDYKLCALANDNACFLFFHRTSEDLRGNTNLMKEEKFMIKHCHFDKSPENFIVHIPSASPEDKLILLQTFSNKVIR